MTDYKRTEKAQSTQRELDKMRALGLELGGREAGSALSPLWEHEDFLRWTADQARSDDRVARRRADGEALRHGVAMIARAQARALGVRVYPGHPPVARPGTRPAPSYDMAVAAGAGRELWDTERSALVAVPDDLPPGDYVALRVTGTSMTPLLHRGDTVLVRRGGRVGADSVIVARKPDDGYVCKRVRRVKRSLIELESLEPGNALVKLPNEAHLVLGTVLMTWCPHMN